MAEVEVDAARLATGDLPRVCVVTGEPADGLVDVRLGRSPGWAWVLVPVSLMAFLFANLLGRETVRGEVPVTRAVFEAHQSRRRASLVVTVASLLVAALAAWVPVWWLVFVALGVALFVGAGLAAVAERRFISGHAGDNGRTVVLRRVHPAFAAAVAEVPVD